jgi:hypothetical protein
MRKYIVFLFGLTLIAGSCSLLKKHHNFDEKAYEKAQLDAYYLRLLDDPKTGKIPTNIRQNELEFASILPKYSNNKRSEDIWKSRGPNNQGGRTRAVALDVNNSNTILAGSATGGIYKSTDAGQTWIKAKCPANAITCIIQDTRAGKTNIWYAGTGELSGSSGTATGAYYYGQGIFKSTDGGNTWTVIPFTNGGSTTAFDSDFDGVWNIAIDYSNAAQDEIYAATYGGIYKTVDGGLNWKKKRSGSLPNYSYYTDVAVDKLGVVYATMSSESTQKGIWRSIDGETWISITPAGFPSTYGRMCIGIAPSDQNQVYSVASNTTNYGFVSTNFQGTKEWNSLWKFDYMSGNGSGSGGRWVNRSSNMPDAGGDFGYYSTQGGYDLFIKVKPNDTNVVFIGATNLWRSDDAFRSNKKINWIGGYAVNTTRPDFKLYPNHHPDNHQLIFYPNNSDLALSSHDGGISYTSNIMANNVSWESKNNNYITSQFYTIAVDHSLAYNNKIMGGLQDNGTQFTDVYGLSSWQMSFNGDGSYCSFVDGTNEIIGSAQQGRIAHLELDKIGQPIKYARIDPKQLNRDNYDFINPFVLDPNDQKIMYLPAKNKIFRNLNIFSKPLSTNFDSTRWDSPLWEELSNCKPLTGQEFSAISISKINKNTLYYATDKGRLYKLYNANLGQPIPIEITGSNFPSGNINCIALDPSDTNKITVVFSNYNITSVFTSDNAGTSWINISGNLEENTNGSGSGPSCRWAAVLNLENGRKCWFIATSVGLYATDTLNGIQTRWIQQSPYGIGNNIVTMLDTREKDNFIAVATHGNGAYSANISNPWQITDIRKNIINAATVKVYPNPLPLGESLTLILKIKVPQIPDITITDALGNFISKEFYTINSIDSENIKIQFRDLSSGIYFVNFELNGESFSQKIIRQ